MIVISVWFVIKFVKLLGQNSLYFASSSCSCSVCPSRGLATTRGVRQSQQCDEGSDLLDDLHDVLVVQNVFDANALRLMLDRRAPDKTTVKVNKVVIDNNVAHMWPTTAISHVLFEFTCNRTMQLVAEVLH